MADSKSTHRPPPRQAEFDPNRVRDISTTVYRDRMGDTDADAMISKVGAEKFRDRAGSYDVLTRAYLRAIGVVW